MVAINKNKYSTVVAIKNGKTLYLSSRDEEHGLDAHLNMQGWDIIAIDDTEGIREAMRK